MPYVDRETRDRIDAGYSENKLTKPGELNYRFTKEILRYIHNKGESYTTYNEIVGVLECCKLELYRRLVAPYESKKINENGDVY